MSNYLKTLNVTFTPPSGGWDETAKTKTLSNPDGNTPIQASNAIDDDFGLWPETTYTITANAVDSYDQAVTVNIASQSYETKRDFPAFHNMSAGHAILKATGQQSGEELNVFNNRNNKTYGLNQPDTLFTSVTDGNTESDGTKNQLNGAFLNASSFKVDYLSDYSDPNIYDLEDLTNWIQLSGVSDIASSRYGAYYGFNSFIPKADAAIEFDSYNKKLGVYTIGASLYKGVLGTDQTVTPITLAATPVRSDISPTAVCTDTNAFFDSIDEGDADAGKDLAIPVASSGAITYPVNSIYKTKVDDLSATVVEEEIVDNTVSVLGISTDEWRDNEEDAVWTLDIKATAPHKTGSSYNVPTESDMRINLWTLFPPRQVLKKVVVNSGTQSLNEVQFSSQNWYAESPEMTSINFTGRNVPYQGDEKVGYFNFSTETDSRRPFLPLVHKNLDVSNYVFGFVPGFDTKDDDNDYENFFIANDPIGTYQDDGDICTFGTAFVVEGLFEPLGSNEALAILSNPCDPELNWKVLTMHDTETSLTTGKIDDDFYEAVMADKTKVENISNDIGFSAESMDDFNRALSTGTEEDRNFTQTIYRTSWPDYDTTIDYNTSTPLGAGTNFYQELIPGRYYAFKVTSANYAGISSKPFIIKTAEAESSTLITTINNDSTTTGTNTQPGTYQIGSISIQTESTLPIDVTFQLGAGTQIANNSVIEITDTHTGHTYTSQGATSWNGTSPAFSTSGTYTLTITSPTTKLANDNSGSVIAPIIHTYEITVTDSNSLSVTTGNASSVGIDSATLNGSWTKTGSHNVTAEGFKWWVTSDGENTATTIPVSETTSSFSYNLSSLSPNTSYTYKAYATSDDTTIGTNGTVWGQPVTFTTDSNVNPVNLDFNSITRTTGTITVS